MTDLCQTEDALELSREYYANSKLKRKYVCPTKLVDMEGIAKHFNIMLLKMCHATDKTQADWYTVAHM